MKYEKLAGKKSSYATAERNGGKYNFNSIPASY